MNISKLTRHCGLILALGLAVAAGARGQDIGDPSGSTACTGCQLEIGGLISKGAILDARWDGKYVLTAVRHSARSLRIVKELDKLTPLLQQAFQRGTPLPEVTLSIRQGEGRRQYNPYVTVDYIERIRMQNVYVTSYQTGSSRADGSIPTETLSLNFEEIKVHSPNAPGHVPEAADEVLVGFEQGDDAAAADLLPLDGLTLATSIIPWGQTATISSNAASSKQAGRCFFRYRYDTGNQGQAVAGATANRLHLDAANGPPLATDALPGLPAGDQHTASGLLPLVVGTWTLYVHVDDDLVVPEGDEQNNLRRVRVRVEGSCEDDANRKDVTPPGPAEEQPSGAAQGYPVKSTGLEFDRSAEGDSQTAIHAEKNQDIAVEHDGDADSKGNGDADSKGYFQIRTGVSNHDEVLLQLSGMPVEKVVVRGWDPKHVSTANPRSLEIEVVPGKLLDVLRDAQQTGKHLNLILKTQDDGKYLEWELRNVRVTSYSVSGATDGAPPSAHVLISLGDNRLMK